MSAVNSILGFEPPWIDIAAAGALASGSIAIAAYLEVRQRRHLLASVVSTVGGLLAGLVSGASEIGLSGVFGRLGRPVDRTVLTILLGLGLGWALFGLRRRSRVVYGFLEIVVAAASLAAVGIQAEAPHALPAAVGFAGAVYVFVRGMTNVEEGRALSVN